MLPFYSGGLSRRGIWRVRDLSPFPLEARVLTAEPSMVLQPYLDTRNPDQLTLRLMPRGPVVLRGDLPAHK